MIFMGQEAEKMQSEEKTTPAKKKKRRGQGVPFGLVTLLVVLALVCGGVAGYLGGAKFSGAARKLKEAQATIADYELTLMEMYSDEFEKAAKTDQSSFDSKANAALSGAVSVSDSAEPVVVAEYTGGTVMSDEAVREFQTTLSNYALEGTDVTQTASAILDTVLENLVGDKVAYQKAVEKGYTTLTDDDRAQIAAKAQAAFDETVDFYLDIVREDGMTDDDVYAAAVKYLADNEGYTIDTVTQTTEDHWWYDKLYADVVSGVSVTADQINAAYNEQLAQQQTLFTQTPKEFENALLNGDMILYYPEGYRTVKQILFELDDTAKARVSEIAEQLKTETNQDTIAQLNAELNELYAPAEAKAKEAAQKIKDGSNFDEMMQQYSDDDELNNGAFSSTGYYVAQNSVMWPEDFISACMALANPGDVSNPVRSDGGVHIIQFVANVQPGAVPLSQVNAQMTQSTLESAQFEEYQSQLQTWLSQANVKYYPERILNDE